MAIEIRFEKTKGQRLLQKLKKRGQLQAPRREEELLKLAGACFHLAVASRRKQRGIDVNRLPSEYKEAVDEKDFRDLHEAIEHYGYIFWCIDQGRYDDEFNPSYSCVIEIGDGEVKFKRRRGYRLEE
jgi:hypothetical protein